MKRLSPNRRGYTLVEMIITVAVVSILLLGTFSVLSQLFTHFTLVQQTSTAKSIADTSYTMISEKLKFSNGIWLTGAPTNAERLEIGPDSITHYKSDGSIGYQLPSEFFSPYTINVSMGFDITKNKITQFEIDVSNANGIVYSADPVDLIPINLENASTTTLESMYSFTKQDITTIYFTQYDFVVTP